MEAFLRASKNCLANSGDYRRIRVILGNPTCDLDSAVCALAYGYCEHLRNEGKDVGVVAVLNVTRDEFRLKTEVVYYLRRCNVPRDLLTFRNDIDLPSLRRRDQLELILVDHHALPEADAQLSDCVLEVIDHRPQDPRWPWTERRLVLSPVGSCATLVARDVLERLPDAATTLCDLLRGIREAAGALVSIKRIREFLLLEEIQQSKSCESNNNLTLAASDDVSLSFNKVSVKWNSESKFEALKQISFQLQRGSLTAVIGQVGAGKTTLFQAILKEIPEIRGEVKINGKISYASQEPWVFTSSIKQNILFGKPMDHERYKKVIEACQLKRDYELLPYGENTLVGEKGINLSGGQCARINLARAVYHEADIYLLDDPLSAVDAQVSKGIFEECIKTFLKDKTVILNTHQYHFLKQVDRIIVLDDGTVLADGTYTELVDSGINFMKLESETEEISGNEQNAVRDEGVRPEVMTEAKVEEEQSESRTVGGISMKTYVQYFKVARNGFLVFLVFLTSIACQIFKSGADYFITYWVNVEENGESLLSSGSDDDLLRGRSWYIYVYASIALLLILMTLVQTYSFCHMCMNISRNLHDMMFTNITKTKMSFFNANPIGRIMNRFSKDMGLVDVRIPVTMADIIRIGLNSFAIFVIVATINPWLLIAAVILVVAANFIRSFYIKTSRSVKRLEGISPILIDTANFSEEAARATPLDHEMMAKLEKVCGLGPGDRAQLHQDILDAKTDISELTAGDLLIKDLKVVNGIPIPGFPILVKDFLELAGATEALEAFCHARDAPLAVLVGMDLKGDQLTRDIAVYSLGPDQAANKLIEALTTSSSPDLQLTELKRAGGDPGKLLLLYNQANVRATRKQILPIIQSASASA